MNIAVSIHQSRVILLIGLGLGNKKALGRRAFLHYRHSSASIKLHRIVAPHNKPQAFS